VHTGVTVARATRLGFIHNNEETRMPALTRITVAVAAACGAHLALAAPPAVVKGPGENPACFKPWSDSTKYFQWPAKKGPYRVALANGFVGNTWRIQMIKMAKAYAATPEMKSQLKEFKIVSTGTDVAAQVAAIDNFINSGYDAIVTIAVNPTAFAPVIKRANAAGVVLVPFDNVLDSDEVMMVNEDQLAMGVKSGEWVVKNIPSKSGKLLEVRGLPGNSVDRDRHLGFRKAVEAPGNKFEVVEVVGNWDDGTAQKATADALAVHGKFEAVFTQGGSTGSVRAMMDAKHPFVPMAGEGENGYRKLIAKHAGEGLKGLSYSQSPGLVSISMKAALSALEGNPMPQLISVPIPVVDYTTLKDNVNYWSNLSDNFFAANEFPACGVNVTAPEIMAKDAKNTQ